MPLPYGIRSPLNIPTDAFNNEVAIVFANGTRYGGRWNIAASFSADSGSLGEIQTSENPNPDMAVDTAYVWINDYCASHDMKILKFENLNSQYPPDQAPYFALARFFLAHPAEPSPDWKPSPAN